MFNELLGLLTFPSGYYWISNLSTPPPTHTQRDTDTDTHRGTHGSGYSGLRGNSLNYPFSIEVPMVGFVV